MTTLTYVDPDGFDEAYANWLMSLSLRERIKFWWLRRRLVGLIRKHKRAKSL